ncbi:hypothetical protein R1flu_018440 [Riccia fluitans]|uniref:Cytochrome P450 n=1 Tax=Riccia fluitans TaxID=41844 RepID=A0ABD1ZFU4_9MARC
MWKWCSLIEGGVVICFIVLLLSYGAGGLKWLRLSPALRKRYTKLPKGSLGWPLVGETLALQHCLMSTTPHSFVNERRRRYGNFFLTHLFGSPLLASTDPDMNRFILNKEEPLFTSSLPKTLSMVVGQNALLMLTGDRHKRIRRLTTSVFSPEVLRHHSGRIQQLAISVLKTWKGRKVIVADEARQYTFNVALSSIMNVGHTEKAELFRVKFSALRSGARALPIDLPGTAFRTALQARKYLAQMIEEEIEERKRSKDIRYDDLLEKLIQAPEADGGETLQNEEIIDLVLSSMLAGFDTSANTLLFLIYYIGQHPNVLHDLKIEHQEILREKAADDHQPLSYADYKKMKLTQLTINETLRIANPILSLHRRTLQDVEYNGRIIPANCAVQVWLRSLHTDPTLYPDPYSFDLDRWQGKPPTSNNFIPFGMGPRRCVGMELARMELCFFLHCLVTMYSWELAEEDSPRFFPDPGMRKGSWNRRERKVRELTRT